MNSTAAEIITQAYLKAGVVAPGSPVPGALATQALLELNAMLDSWNIDPHMIFRTPPTIYTLVGGVATDSGTYYTIGPGGTLNGPRPIEIEKANIIWDPGGGGTKTTIPVELLNRDQWSQLRVRNTPSTFPVKAWYDEQYTQTVPVGLARIYVYPVPTATSKLELFCWEELPTFPALSTPVRLPPGYFNTMVYNLAVRVATGLVGIDNDVAVQARDFLEQLQRKNAPEPRLANDAAGHVGGPRRRSTWSYLTGQ